MALVEFIRVDSKGRGRTGLQKSEGEKAKTNVHVTLIGLDQSLLADGRIGKQEEAALVYYHRC